jgi:hypothetical protein
MRMYLTKQALTAGIIAADCKRDGEWVTYASELGASIYKVGRDAFEDPAAAQVDANQRRLKKISSLKKQISKLEKMTFTVPQ